MTDKPLDKNLLPDLVPQNPAPLVVATQGVKDVRRSQVDRIMEVFLQLLPSNYVSQVQGPFYTMQFQAVAERIADFQITAQEVWADSDFDYTRSEFLYQLIGMLVFPDAQTDGYPVIEGDITYRTFLKRMVALLLQGAKKTTIEEGLALITDADIEVLERAILARGETVRWQDPKTGEWLTEPGSAWGLNDQFVFEINVSEEGPNGGRFPEKPFVLLENARIVLRALKPAHTIYDYRHLFREAFGPLFDGSVSWELDQYFYADFRRFCLGAYAVTGTNGVTWNDRTLFSDTSRDFGQVAVGASLTVLSGPNGIHAGGTEGTAQSTDRKHVGRYTVADVLYFPMGDDDTARSYTTSPTGLSGRATVSGTVIEDLSQNWALAVDGEKLTFTEGPNAGTYRLKTLQGSGGGPVGEAAGPATRVAIAPSLLRLDRRMGKATAGQSYEVTVDRLGVQVPHVEAGEDASAFFLL